MIRRTIRFYYQSKYETRVEIRVFEFPKGTYRRTQDNQIEAVFTEWVYNISDNYWEDVEERPGEDKHRR